MCGIAGFCNLNKNYMDERKKWEATIKDMNRIQKHRGPDDEGVLLTTHVGLAHVRLSIIDLKNGNQPMTAYPDRKLCSIIHNGTIYNMNVIKKRLGAKGISFQTTSDTEVILQAYLDEGPDFVKELNGVFSFAIWDERIETLWIYRDHLGIKPLFYTLFDNTLLFSSEIKGLFSYPGFYPQIDQNSLREVFGLGPAKSYGKGVFAHVEELLSGHYLQWNKDGLKDHTYWQLESEEPMDSFDDTLNKTRDLVVDSVQNQMLSDVPISTFLSGGVDSSIVTAICAEKLKEQGKVLNTFSFDFVGNDKYFKSNAFQPSRDRPYVEIMVDTFKTNHFYLDCSNQDQLDYLFKCVDARDLPCMADIESSMMYFCSKVTDYNKVTLTGECADEIFGGYPWFHKKECFEADIFPWSMDMSVRNVMLKDEVRDTLRLGDYVKHAYYKTICETPVLPGENPTEKRRREIAYLNLKWFMVTLLDRTDRTSMHCGLEARVPLADYRILEYVWNVP